MKVVNNDIVTQLRGHNIETEVRPRRDIKMSRRASRGSTFVASRRGFFVASRHTSLVQTVEIMQIVCRRSSSLYLPIIEQYIIYKETDLNGRLPKKLSAQQTASISIVNEKEVRDMVAYRPMQLYDQNGLNITRAGRNNLATN